MKTIREFCPQADRYAFDFELCSVAKGFAQVDTSQDASYFGTWANPTTMTVVTYIEGDVVIRFAENEAEFRDELIGIERWNLENGHDFKGIDAMCNVDLKSKFQNLGLSDLLH